MDIRRSFDIDDGIQNEGAVILSSLVGLIRSHRVQYTNEIPTQIDYYRSASQTNNNRIFTQSITYVDEMPDQSIINVYQNDGVTIEQTITTDYSYTNDLINRVDEVIG